MKAVILAAGKGTRMLPLTKKVPKPMIGLHGKPILEHILENLPEKVSEIIIVIGNFSEQIQKHFGDNFKNKKIKYVFQEKTQGTWKALKLAKNFFDKVEKEKFLLLNADDLQDKSALLELVNFKNGILACESLQPEKFGVIEHDQDGFLQKITEKPQNPKTNLVATGVYVFSTNIFECQDPVPQNGEYFLTNVLQEFLEKNKIKVVKTKFWLPIGSVEELVKAHDII